MIRPIILGSQSPRRRDILQFLKVPFRQESPDFDETQVLFHGDPVSFVKETAVMKSIALQDRFPGDIILTADTTVFREGKLFMKPESLEEAFIMLSELSGKDHFVYTAVALSHGSTRYVECEMTRVYFHPLTEKQIRTYHRQFNPLDKAGSYAIQEAGSIIVKKIEGCYYNIMGLPITTTRNLLSYFNIDLWDYLNKSH